MLAEVAVYRPAVAVDCTLVFQPWWLRVRGNIIGGQDVLVTAETLRNIENHGVQSELTG